MTYEMSNIRKQLDDFKSILKESEQPIPDVSGAQSIEELIEIMQTHPRFNRIGTLTSRIIPKFQREKEAVEGNYARMGPEDNPRQAMLNLTPNVSTKEARIKWDQLSSDNKIFRDNNLNRP